MPDKGVVKHNLKFIKHNQHQRLLLILQTQKQTQKYLFMLMFMYSLFFGCHLLLKIF